MAQAVKHLPTKCESLSLKPSTAKIKIKAIAVKRQERLIEEKYQTI
jgi:hypothetical protein